MAVLITDAMRLGGRRMMNCILLLILGYIHYACAADAPPTAVKLSAAGGSDVARVSGLDIFKVTNTPDVTLTCSATDGNGATAANLMQFVFMKGTAVIDTCGWSVTPTCLIAAFDVDKAGHYSCNARDAGQGTAEAASPKVITLTPDCDGAANVCTDKDGNSECDTGADKYCKCKSYGGVFPTCNGCKGTSCGTKGKCEGAPANCACKYGGNYASDDSACDACKENGDCGTNAVCEATSPKTCKCTYGGTPPDACNACNGTHHGCTATGKEPRCDGGSPAKCTKCNPDFCKTIKGKEVCDEKEGNCKAKAETSDAATVTSTACLVIASVVVALMN